MFLIESCLLYMPISKAFTVYIYIENRLTNSIYNYYKNTQHDLSLDEQNLASCRSRGLHVGMHMQLHVSCSVIFIDVLRTEVKKKHSIANPPVCGNNLRYDSNSSLIQSTQKII